MRDGRCISKCGDSVNTLHSDSVFWSVLFVGNLWSYVSNVFQRMFVMYERYMLSIMRTILVNGNHDSTYVTMSHKMVRA